MMGLRETLARPSGDRSNLKEILDAATPGPWTWMGGYPQRITNPGAILVAETFTHPDSRAYNAELIALAPELAARNLEAAERLRDVREFYGHLMGKDELADHDALLARLDQLGKEQTDGPTE